MYKFYTCMFQGDNTRVMSLGIVHHLVNLNVDSFHNPSASGTRDISKRTVQIKNVHLEVDDKTLFIHLFQCFTLNFTLTCFEGKQFNSKFKEKSSCQVIAKSQKKFKIRNLKIQLTFSITTMQIIQKMMNTATKIAISKYSLFSPCVNKKQTSINQLIYIYFKIMIQ